MLNTSQFVLLIVCVCVCERAGGGGGGGKRRVKWRKKKHSIFPGADLGEAGGGGGADAFS